MTPAALLHAITSARANLSLAVDDWVPCSVLTTTGVVYEGSVDTYAGGQILHVSTAKGDIWIAAEHIVSIFYNAA